MNNPIHYFSEPDQFSPSEPVTVPSILPSTPSISLTLLSSKRALSHESGSKTSAGHEISAKRLRRDSDALSPFPAQEEVGGKAVSDSRSPARITRARSSSSLFFPSAEEGATMFGAAEEAGGLRTVKLARGVAGSSSPARPASKGPSRHPSDNDRGGVTRRTSESRHQTGEQLLASANLIDFLEQDDRPTFMIDLGDELNFSSNNFHILFMNNALRKKQALLVHIRGNSDDPTQMLDLTTSFTEFKAWSLTTHVNMDPQDMPSLSFPYAGCLWKSFTIRKRLRVINCLPDVTSSSEQDVQSRPSLQLYQGLSSSTIQTPFQQKLDSPGYFDTRPVRHTPETPSHLESLVMSSFPEESTTGQNEYSSVTNGDMGISELLASSISPSSQQRTFAAPIGEVERVASMLDVGFFDWTRLPLSPSLPPHIQFARGVDWAATSLGPIEDWSAELRGMCNLIMASPHPAAMYWGRDNVAIYNEAYIPLAGQKHPWLMGARYQDAWAEIWPAIEDVFTNAYASAQATMKDDDCLFMERNGYLEETYFSWSIIPLIGDDGSVVGTYNPAFEKTRRKIAERRMLTLREVGERTASAREVSKFWGLVLEGLEYNEYDAPLVMVYSLSEEVSENDGASSTSSTVAPAKQCYLEGTLGVISGHRAAPPQIDIKIGTQGFGAAFRQALTRNRPIVLRADDATLDMEIFEGIEWRGYGDPAKVVVVSPIQPTTGESTLGFLVMAANPRRPYDEDYDLFIQLLGRQLATSVASVVLFEEEIRKGEEAAKLAAQDRIELSKQLAERTQEAEESENKFTRMAELAPVGMFIGDSLGRIIFCNDSWYDITAYPKGVPVGNNWFEYVKEEDREIAKTIWHQMMDQLEPISTEFRFKSLWKDKLGNQGDTWVLASAYPEKNEYGLLKRVFGSVTDISSQKFAENMQKRRMEEAVEMKRQAEFFIDSTSHEMRNPLGAVLLSSWELTTNLTELKAVGGLTEEQAIAIDSSIEAASTITLCAQHQKRIVDDVLTLSKLDSAMLLVTPVDAQPVTVIQRALKMFEGELKTADIVLDFRIDASYYSMGIDWVRLDPSRLLQVLINLTTNAIKFTTTQESRTILIHLAASKDRPSKEDRYRLTYIPRRDPDARDITTSSDWGSGESIYIHFAVQDTGRGLTEEETVKLFQRFSQANPRTHVTYGGSGLGLFICRQLVELQGGEIGVASESGKGSTFAFYVKAKRSEAPTGGVMEDSIDQIEGRKSLSKAKKTVISPAHPIPKSPKPRRSSTTAYSPQQWKILIVEDNLINQRVLANQLRKIGCTVYLANHGGEAIEQIKKSWFWKGHESDGVQISVVLMDLEMPVMNGQTCARKLREMQEQGDIVRHIPVIAVTANVRDEQIRLTLEAGMDDVVSKPFRIPELMPKIQDLLTKFENYNYDAPKISKNV